MSFWDAVLAEVPVVAALWAVYLALCWVAVPVFARRWRRSTGPGVDQQKQLDS